ncbi:MAG: hypothetical protein ACLGQW_01365 [Acidobacteriota bacterium]
MRPFTPEPRRRVSGALDFLRWGIHALAVAVFILALTFTPPGGGARAAQQAGQGAPKPAATVLFSGEFTSRKAGTEIAGAPGVRFGIEFKLEGAEPRVLTVRLTRPAPEGAPGEDVWLLAAGPGQPVQAAWEFAYAWEVTPGPWEMKIFDDEAELASSRFQVVRVPEPVKVAPAPEPAPAPALSKDKKNGSTGKTAGKKGGKPDAAKPETAKLEPAKPGADRPDPASAAPAKSSQTAQAQTVQAQAPQNAGQAQPPAQAQAPAPAAQPRPEPELSARKQAPTAEENPPVPPKASPEAERVQKRGSKPESEAQAAAQAAVAAQKQQPKAEAAPGAAAQPPTETAGQAQKQPSKTVTSAQPTPVAASQKTAPRGEAARPPAAKPEPARPEPSKAEPDAARSGKATGLAGDRRVYALIAGSFSEQARAMWMAVLVREQGVKACVRPWEKDGRRLWQLVAGWRNSPDEAQAAKAELGVKLGEIIIVPMSAGDLEKGLQCR